MSEVTVPQTLSGYEVIEAVLAEARRMLIQDCYLSPNMAYESFSGKLSIEIRAKDNGIVNEVDRTIVVSSDPPPDPNDPDVFLNIAEAQMEDRPPNEVRRESDQDIPVIVETPDGRTEEKRIRYKKKQDIGL